MSACSNAFPCQLGANKMHHIPQRRWERRHWILAAFEPGNTRVTTTGICTSDISIVHAKPHLSIIQCTVTITGKSMVTLINRKWLQCQSSEPPFLRFWTRMLTAAQKIQKALIATFMATNTADFRTNPISPCTCGQMHIGAYWRQKRI